MTTQRSIAWLKGLVDRLTPEHALEETATQAISTLREALLNDLKFYDPYVAGQIQALLDRVEARGITPPLLPQVALELLALSQSSHVNFEQMAHLAASDPAVAARIMELGSSPMVSSLGPPKGVKEAVIRMGVHGVRQIAFELAYASKTFKRGPHVRMAERIIGHARTTSTTCRLLARDVGVHGGLAALTGLVHALGGIVLIDALSSSSSAPSLRTKRNHREIPGFLVYLCVTKLHPMVTGQMATHFGLDPQLIEAVSDHHRSLENAQTLTRLLYLSDRISAGEPGSRAMPLSEAIERSALNISKERVQAHLQPLKGEIAAASS